VSTPDLPAWVSVGAAVVEERWRPSGTDLYPTTIAKITPIWVVTSTANRYRRTDLTLIVRRGAGIHGGNLRDPSDPRIARQLRVQRDERALHSLESKIHDYLRLPRGERTTARRDALKDALTAALNVLEADQ
jgi:hypothetical protein